MKKLIIISFFCGITVYPAFSQTILTLEQCKTLALQNSEKIQNATLSVEAAELQRKEAFTKYFPSVSATGFGYMASSPMMSMEFDMSSMLQPAVSALTPVITPIVGWLAQQGVPIDLGALGSLAEGLSQPQRIEMLKNGVVGSVMATQPLFAGGQIVNGNRLAKAGVAVRQLQQQLSEKEVALETERTFWQMVSTKASLETIANSDSLLTRLRSDVQVAVEAGLTTRNDLLRIELEQNRLASGRLKAENGLQMLKMVMAQRIGMSADDFDIETPSVVIAGLTRNNPNEDGIATAAAMTGKVENRPEYRLLEKAVDVAKLQVNMEIGKNLPTVAIGAGYNMMRFDWNNSSGMKNNFGMAFATISVPITDWWSGTHAIKRKKIELQQAENTRRENADLLQQQMQSVNNELSEARSQVTLARKSIASAEENLKISRDNYNAGITTLSDLLEAQNLLQQSRDQYTGAVAEYYMKLAEWRQVNGE